jgi:transcriptional regulator with XRE-family HTH domain
MTISHGPSVLSEINDETPIPTKTLRYFRRLLQNRFHEMILEAFIEQEQKEGLTQKQLAARIGRDAAIVNRWLNTASNYEIDTISDLLLGLKLDLDDPSYTSFDELERRLRNGSGASLAEEIVKEQQPIEPARQGMPAPAQPPTDTQSLPLHARGKANEVSHIDGYLSNSSRRQMSGKNPVYGEVP